MPQDITDIQCPLTTFPSITNPPNADLFPAEAQAVSDALVLLPGQLNTFVTTANAAAVDMQETAEEIEALAISAANSAQLAASAANINMWSSTNPYNYLETVAGTNGHAYRWIGASGVSGIDPTLGDARWVDLTVVAASNAETAEGVIANRAVTPASLAAMIGNAPNQLVRIGSNGYISSLVAPPRGGNASVMTVTENVNLSGLSNRKLAITSTADNLIVRLPASDDILRDGVPFVLSNVGNYNIIVTDRSNHCLAMLEAGTSSTFILADISGKWTVIDSDGKAQLVGKAGTPSRSIVAGTAYTASQYSISATVGLSPSLFLYAYTGYPSNVATGYVVAAALVNGVLSFGTPVAVPDAGYISSFIQLTETSASVVFTGTGAGQSSVYSALVSVSGVTVTVGASSTFHANYTGGPNFSSICKLSSTKALLFTQNSTYWYVELCSITTGVLSKTGYGTNGTLSAYVANVVCLSETSAVVIVPVVVSSAPLILVSHYIPLTIGATTITKGTELASKSPGINAGGVARLSSTRFVALSASGLSVVTVSGSTVTDTAPVKGYGTNVSALYPLSDTRVITHAAMPSSASTVGVYEIIIDDDGVPLFGPPIVSTGSGTPTKIVAIDGNKAVVTNSTAKTYIIDFVDAVGEEVIPGEDDDEEIITARTIAEAARDAAIVARHASETAMDSANAAAISANTSASSASAAAATILGYDSTADEAATTATIKALEASASAAIAVNAAGNNIRGTDPDMAPSNAMLGTAAYLDQTWLYASATWDAGSCNSAAQVSSTVAVPGVEIGDKVFPSASIALSGLHLRGEVTATDVVTLYLSNLTGAAVDLASATYYVAIMKRVPTR